MIKKIVFTLCFVLLATTAKAKLMDLAVFQLDNGMNVAVIENHKAPVALAMVYYNVGSVNDPVGKGGIAHLLEHMMFRGTKKLPEQMFNRLTDKYGAESNAYTTYQETVYYEFADVSKLELMLALEAERMQNLVIDEEAFLKERDVVLQERKQRFETKPTPLFMEMINKALWQNHPLANPVSGTAKEIVGLTKNDAIEFYRKYYHPSNALLVISGDVKLNEAKRVVKKYFGGIKKQGEKTVFKYDKERVVDAEMMVKLPGVTQPKFVQFIRLDAKMLSPKEVLALEMLVDYLAGDDTDYLYENLVYGSKKLLTVSMDVSYSDDLGGNVSLGAIPVNDNDKLGEIKGLLAKTIDDGVKALTDEKLQKVKNRVLSDAVYLQESPEDTARFVGGMLMSGYQVDDIINFDKAVAEITLDDVLAVWQKVCSQEAQVSGFLEGK